MKKFILLLLLGVATLPVTAQNVPIDFEASGNGASWTWTVFENDLNPPVDIIANPDMSGANTSATVAKFTALQTGNPWAGCETTHGAGIGTWTVDSTNAIIKIMVWKSEISDVGIKLVEPSNAALPEIKVPNTMINQWEELTFDFTSHIGATYDQIVVFPDFNARAQDNIIYFDNITFGAGQVSMPPMTPAPTPTIPAANVISMFSNAYTDVPVDTWLTSWSAANQSDIQIQGDDTKLYENLDFAGVETVGPNVLDVTAMDFFHMDVWTDDATLFRIKLVDFGADGNFGGGDDSEHEIEYMAPAQGSWISYMIPMADFSGLQARAHMAQLIISGQPVGGATIYMDNVYYSTTATNVSAGLSSTVELFPNPAQNSFTLRSEQAIDQIQVVGLMGEVVLEKSNIGNEAQFDISTLAAGVYTVLASSNGVTTVKKLVKN